MGPTQSPNMKMLVVLALAAVACAEPEADAQLLTYNTSPLVSAFNTYTHQVAAPLVKAAVPAVTYKAAVPAVTYNTVPTPAVYNAAVSPVVYAQPQVATHTITNYNNPEHYTAVSNGVFGPKYIAKNGAVQHVVKREAEAEAEAEADADALLYNTLPPLQHCCQHCCCSCCYLQPCCCCSCCHLQPRCCCPCRYLQDCYPCCLQLCCQPSGLQLQWSCPPPWQEGR